MGYAALHPSYPVPCHPVGWVEPKRNPSFGSFIKGRIMKRQKNKILGMKTIFLMGIICFFFSCGKGEKEGGISLKIPETSQSALEEKQQEVANEIVKEIKTPIDLAKGVAEKEAQRVAEQQSQANQ